MAIVLAEIQLNEWEELVNNTALDISKIKKEKVKCSLKEERHVRYRTDEELDHIMNDFGGILFPFQQRMVLI